jgi:hypothetical protein
MAYPKTQYNPPETLVRTGHSVTIIAGGKTIGLINSWSPQQDRQISPIYEINSETSGLILEHIPGNIQNTQISVQRYDIWPNRMEDVFGTTDLYMLSNQKSPFVVQEKWLAPSNALEVWQYEGCWFRSIGRSFRSDDTRIINVSATLVYTYRSKVQGL